MTPIWATFPIIMHRPLPRDGIIKWAWAQRRRIGTRWRWELQLVLETEIFDDQPAVGSGTCAIDIGWRARTDGLRVGYLVDDRGNHEEFLLPSIVRDKIDHANSLQAIRDRNFDEVRAQIGAWMADHDASAWLTASIQHLARWRSCARLRKVAQRWRNERFGGDGEIFDVVDAWRRQDVHLHQWEASERTRVLGLRKEHYRLLAHRLCRQYSTIVLEHFELDKVIRRPKAEEEDNSRDSVRYNRTVAAVSELREAIGLLAHKAGARVVQVPAEDTTTTCHVCKVDCSEDPGWDPVANLSHECTQCRTVWDQDANAAYNMLTLFNNGTLFVPKPPKPKVPRRNPNPKEPKPPKAPRKRTTKASQKRTAASAPEASAT